MTKTIHPQNNLWCDYQTIVLRTDNRAAGNSTFAIGGVSCSADSLLVTESFVLRINICAENPAHRKSAKRSWQLEKQKAHNKKTDNTCPKI
jgi:hypothetical protein